MIRYAVALLSLSCLFSSSALAQDDLLVKAKQQFEPIPTAPPELPGNAATPAKVELGKMLYFDPRLSASHAISCSSCHNIGLGGADAEPTSIGHRWQHGGRNAPTVFNAVFNTAQFWDGRAKDLEQQAGGPMVNPVEMASPESHVAEQLKGIPGYGELFAKAFPGEPDLITLANAQKAIAVFEATLITPNAPFDRFPERRAERAFADAEGGLGGLHGQGMLGLPQRHQRRRRHVRPVRCGRKAGCRVPAARRQGPIHGHQDPERRVCLQGPDAPEHRADGALFPHRESLGSAPGRGRHGSQSARHSADRRRSRQDHRLPRQLDRRTAEGDVPHPSAKRREHAPTAAVIDVIGSDRLSQ